MTQRQVLNLTKMQASKIGVNGVRMILLKKKGSSVFLKKVLLESRNEKVLGEVISYFVEKANTGDIRSKLFLNRCASEKFNKNEILRKLVIEKFLKLARDRSSFGLRGLLVGVRDSVSVNRHWAFLGLWKLAEKGDFRVLSGLLEGVKDSVKNNRTLALQGLRALADKGHVEAKRALEELKK